MRTFIAAFAAAAVLAACHKQQRIGEMSLSPKVVIQVNNNFTPPDQVTVFITSQTGTKVMLGTVSPGRKGTFNYQPTLASDRFSLLAQTTQGQTMTSQLFTLVDAESVMWDLRSNTMQITEP